VPETVEHVFMMCKKFNREMVLIKKKIEGGGEWFIFRDILSKDSDHFIRVIKYMFDFLKNTGIIDSLLLLFFYVSHSYSDHQAQFVWRVAVVR